MASVEVIVPRQQQEEAEVDIVSGVQDYTLKTVEGLNCNRASSSIRNGWRLNGMIVGTSIT